MSEEESDCDEFEDGGKQTVQKGTCVNNPNYKRHSTYVKANEEKVSAGQGEFRDMYCSDCGTLHKNKYLNQTSGKNWNNRFCRKCKAKRTFFDTLDEVKQFKNRPK